MNPTMYNHDHMSAAHIELRHLDLNLLVALDVLTAERSVTRAAARLGVTQSAMSHTLRRLREVFDDELLVRVRGGMALTPRAESLMLPIRTGLATLEHALSDPLAFDPETSERRFRIAGPDLFELLFLPSLLEHFGGAAGRLSLAMVARTGPRALEALATGELDLAITNRMLDGSEAPSEPGLMRRTLLIDDWSCFLRAGHPALGKARRKLPLRTFLGLGHVVVSTTGRGPGIVDAALAERGEARTVALRVSHFYAAPVALATSDLVLTAPASLARLVDHLELAHLKPPVELPRHSVDMTWHRRFNDDPGHRWLREQLVAATQS